MTTSELLKVSKLRVFLLACGAIATFLSVALCRTANAQHSQAPEQVAVSPNLAAVSPVPSVSAIAPVVTVTVFRRDDGRGSPGVAVAQFAPEDRAQHFEVGVKGLEARSDPVLVRWDFEALETSVGTHRRIATSEQRFPVPTDTKEVLLNGKVVLPRDWPTGRYRATISVNEQPLRMLDYIVGVEVATTSALPSITSITMLSDDGRGKPGQQRLQFVPSDRRIHFRADLGSKFTGKARWRFTAVTTAAGNNVSLLDLQGDVTDVDFLVSQMSAPQDWPIGVYRAELLLNETLAKTIDFTISRS